MIFKLWHKLVLSIIGITGVVLILALYISDQSVKKGFLSYINQVESNRLNGLVISLVDGYQQNEDWEFIRDNRRVWRRYNQRSRTRPTNNSEEHPLPELRELVKKGQTDRGRLPPPEADEGQRRPPPPRGNRGQRPPGLLVLLDKNKQHIVGGGRQLRKMENPALKAIKSNGKLIGYLKFDRFTQFTDQLDKQFIQYQNQAFFKIAFLALAIIFLGAALLAAYLRSRINKIGDHASLLTSGDFSPQSLDKSKDELGQLSSRLGILGSTLEDNRISRRRWVSDISHELRTPVAVLQGEIEAIQDGIRKMGDESVASLHSETLRLSRLIDDLHQLSLSDSGALSYVKEPVNLVSLVRNSLAKSQQPFDSKNITLEFNSSEKELMVLADTQRLEQLFSNLANNSQHYTSESGKVTVHITLLNKIITVEWSDSEPGVTDEELNKLFERLYRVEESRNRNEGGSGLGLSICKNIVEAHEATIIAKHSLLGGITFVISFNQLTKL